MMDFEASANAEHVAEQFHADMLGAPFEIVLINSVVLTLNNSGETKSHFIPDLTGLGFAIIIGRNLHAASLSGSDIKFMRRVLGLKSKNVYPHIGVSREHYSRVENSNVNLPKCSEKLLRIFFIVSAIDSANYNDKTRARLLENSCKAIFALGDLYPLSDLSEPLVMTLSRTSSEECLAPEEVASPSRIWRAAATICSA